MLTRCLSYLLRSVLSLDPLRFCLLGILFAVFLSGGRRVYGQDVDSLLAQLSVHDPAAKRRLDSFRTGSIS